VKNTENKTHIIAPLESLRETCANAINALASLVHFVQRRSLNSANLRTGNSVSEVLGACTADGFAARLAAPYG
jgi:hypothetical protein